MKSISLILSIVLLFILTACEKQNLPEEQAKTENIEKNNTVETNISQTYKEPDPIPQTFILTDGNERDLNITLYKDQMTSQDINQPLILLNLFASWSPPCKGTLPDLNRLQKKYKKELFIVGVLVNDDLNRTELQYFMKKYNTNFYISYAKENTSFVAKITKNLELPENFPIPLSALYRDGKLFRYYKGAMPLEMMESELKQALK